MTRDFANRIGGPVLTGYDGGVFNTLQQYNLNKENDWTKTGSVTLPTNVPRIYESGYYYATFKSPGTFYVTGGAVYIDYFIVAGGGAGGSYNLFDSTAGGGAGGVARGSTLLEPSTYGVRIGPGGTFNTGPYSDEEAHSTPGNPSFITGSPGCKYLIAYGGGAGSSGPDPDLKESQAGGSGGGGSESQTPAAVGNYMDRDSIIPKYHRNISGQGNPGGPGGGTSASGGGGGAGNPGSASGYLTGGDGGIGIAFPFSYTVLPTNTGRTNPDPPDNIPSNARWFAGGGGGGTQKNDSTAVGAGGIGGGGAGGYKDPANPSPGRSGGTNTGGGGGGTGYPGQGGGNGGPGIVIFRYLA